MKYDLKGNENCFELAGDSSYREVDWTFLVPEKTVRNTGVVVWQRFTATRSLTRFRNQTHPAKTKRVVIPYYIKSLSVSKKKGKTHV